MLAIFVKKIRNRGKYETWQAARRLKYLLRRRASHYKRSLKRGGAHGVQTFKSAKRKDWLPIVTLIAPQNFSLLNNPREILAFLREFDQKLRTRHVAVDMSRIETLTAETVAVFVAVLKGVKHKNVKIRGNQPSSPELGEKLAKFGFYEHVESSKSRAKETGNIQVSGNEYLVSIARSNPSAFEADSFQQVSPLPLSRSAYRRSVSQAELVCSVRCTCQR